MAHYQEYRCSGCGNITSPELLTGKKVVFYVLKTPKKTVKSVTIAWLCEACVAIDPDFVRPAYSGPGNTSPALERVRKDEV